MNITYHTMLGVASSAVLVKTIPNLENSKIYKIAPIAIAVNIILHGVLDLLPHSYSLMMIKDGLISLFLIGLSIIFIKRKYKLLTLTCIFGAILPDVIDKIIVRSNSIINSYIFPWHNSGVINKFYSVYLDRIPFQYFKYMDLIIILISLVVLIKYKDIFIKRFRDIKLKY